jgi:hypothetical protein
MRRLARRKGELQWLIMRCLSAGSGHNRETRTHTCTRAQHIMLIMVSVCAEHNRARENGTLRCRAHTSGAQFSLTRITSGALIALIIFYLFRARVRVLLNGRSRKPTIWPRGCQNYFIIKPSTVPDRIWSHLHNYYFVPLTLNARRNELLGKFMALGTHVFTCCALAATASIL